MGSLFLERFERIKGDGSYPILPIPDLFFLTAIGIFALNAVIEYRAGRLAPRPLGRKDAILVGFVVLLGLLSLLALLTLPANATSGVQILKTFTHLVVLLGAAIVLGHALSWELVGHAVRVYFVVAVAVAGLGIVQALDQNVFKLGIADALDLISRAGAVGFVRPCSIFSEPAYLGYASLGGIMAGLTVVSERHRIGAAVGCSVCVVALLLAAAAGPIAIAAPLGLYALVFGRRLFTRDSRLAFVTLVIVAAFVGLLTPVGDTIIYRAEGISSEVTASTETGPGVSDAGADPSFELRRELNRESIKVWREAPVTGVGLGNSRRHLAGEIDVSWLPGDPTIAYTSANAFNSANAYVNLLGESGPGGVGALVLVLLGLWWRNRGATPRLEELTRAFIVLLALQFFIINPLIMPPVWFWAAQRLALQSE